MRREILALASLLAPLVSAAQDSLIVVGRRPPAAASESSVDAAELGQLRARTAEDFLQLVPGLQATQHGSEGKGHQFFLRGFDAAHGSDLRVSVEGIPINEPSNVHGHGYVDLGFLIPETVRTLHAAKGAYAPTQGDFGTAGAVDFRLGVAPDATGPRASYELGTTGRHRGLALWAPDARQAVAAEGLVDEGFGTNRGIRRANLLTALDLAGGDTAWRVWAAGSTARFGLPGAVRRDDVETGRVGFYDTYTADTAGESDRALAALESRVRRGALRLRTRAFAHIRRLVLDENFTGALQYASGDRHEQRHDALEGGVDSELGYRFDRSLRLIVAAHWRGGAIEQREVGLDPTGAETEVRRDLTAAQHAFGVVGGVEWRPRSGSAASWGCAPTASR